MPVPAKPFWLSQANTEFGGNGWASNILSKAGLALPRMAGDLAGMSAFAILNDPGSPYGNPGNGLLTFRSMDGSIWSAGTNTPNIQLTKGICQIRIRHTGGDGTVYFQDASNNVPFTPDSTMRGVGCLAPGFPGYTTITAAIDFILNGVVVKTVNVSCEGSTNRF